MSNPARKGQDWGYGLGKRLLTVSYCLYLWGACRFGLRLLPLPLLRCLHQPVLSEAESTEIESVQMRCAPDLAIFIRVELARKLQKTLPAPDIFSFDRARPFSF